MTILQYLVALSPVFLVLLLLVILRMPATRSMPLAFIIHAALAYMIWKMPGLQIAAATIDGFIIAASLLWVIFGAILLLNIQRASGAIDTISHFFTSISPDRRVQVILIAWLFGAFLEGCTGFGAPAAITAPLLVGLGFPPIAAVVMALISNTFPVIYGSVGLTFFVGIGQGLQQGGVLPPVVQNYLGSMPLADYLNMISIKSALLIWIPCTLLPLMLVIMLTRFWGANKSWKEGLGLWKFALTSGFVYGGFAFLIAWVLGPEFPALLGSMLSLAVMVILVKKKIFIPETAWDFAGHQESAASPVKPDLKYSTTRAMLPYLIVTIILILTRLSFLPFMEWLNIPQLGLAKIFGTQISSFFAPIYSPGAIFTITALMSLFILKMDWAEIKTALNASGKSILSSTIALGTSIPMVRIFIHSSVNSIDLDSMPIELANSMASQLGAVWTLVSPFIGSLGIFISGSTTISNLMFSLMQFSAAIENNLDPLLINSLQLIGAAIGKMICIVSVVAASSTVNLYGEEGRIIRMTMLPSIIFCLMVGLLALLFF